MDTSWSQRISGLRESRQFSDRAPLIESRANGDYYLIDGFEPITIGLEGVAIDDQITGRIKSAQGYRHPDTRPGAWDPRARLVVSIMFAPRSLTRAWPFHYLYSWAGVRSCML
jgi:hypothetical protein